MLHLFLQFIIYLMHELDIFFVNLFLPHFCPIFKSWHWKYLNASSKNHLFFNIFDYFQYKNFLHIHVGGSLISKRDLIVGLFFYFSKKELTLNRTLRACLSKRELFQMIIPSKIYALCYDISQETELKKETWVENCNHWL